MVDFGKLRRAAGHQDELDPVEIFRTLPKPEHVNDLWDTQAAALRSWHERRGEQDLVIKLNTGSGKTLVGILICEALRRELRGPVLYLAPTRQLVMQVVQRAADFGIPADAYEAGGGLPAAFRNGDRVLVASYHALFNGRTVFGLLGKGEVVSLAGIILDDAHTSAATLRDIFSVVVTRKDHERLYSDLVVRFRQAFEKVYSIGRLDDMLAGRDEGVMEVPPWAWIDAAQNVREQIQTVRDDPFRFSFPLVRDFFPLSHALVSREAFTITPLLPPVHAVPSFTECPRRVFMSATLADDGVLVRTFAAGVDSLSRPITTRSVAGLGERMIIAPTLSGLSPDAAAGAARAVIEEAHRGGKGAVVLVPSEAYASAWRDVGDVSMGDDVVGAVDRLLDPAKRAGFLPVLVNRYDGIDLPQDACRVLIMDGKPKGANQYDLYRASLLQGHSSINVGLAQRVEQGLGRGTRGAGDYCVVVLLGKDLVEWLGRRDTLETLTPGTRAQVALGREIAGHVGSADELLSTARQCLNRDDDWKQVHAQRIAEAGEQETNTERLLTAGRLERRAFEMLLFNRPAEAADFLVDAADDESWDKPFRGWLLQLGARAALLAGSYDRCEQLQSRAHSMHRALTKPRGDIQYQRLLKATPQASRVVDVLEQYSIRLAVLESVDTALADLHPAASAHRFEEAIRSLGQFLGLESERPESTTRSGPDNLWLAEGNVGLVIECKHQKTTPVNKDDHGQLRVALEWFKGAYEGWTPIGVIVHPNAYATAQSEAIGSNARALTFEALGRLRAVSKVVYRELAMMSGRRPTLEARAAALLREHRLEAPQLVEAFTVPFRSGG